MELEASDAGWHWDSGANVTIAITSVFTRISGSIRCTCSGKTSSYTFSKLLEENPTVVPTPEPAHPLGGGIAPPSSGSTGVAPVGSGGTGKALPTDVAPPTSGSTGLTPKDSAPTLKSLRSISAALLSRSAEISDPDLIARAELVHSTYRQILDAANSANTPLQIRELHNMARRAAQVLPAADRSRLNAIQTERTALVESAAQLSAMASRIEAQEHVDPRELDAASTNAGRLLGVEPDPDVAGEAAPSEAAKDLCYYDGKSYSAGSIVCAPDKTRLVCNVPGGAENAFWKAEGTCP